MVRKKMESYLDIGLHVPDELVGKYMKLFKTTESGAKAAFRSATVQRVLTLLADDAGVFEQGAVEALHAAQEAVRFNEVKLNDKETALLKRESAVREKENAVQVTCDVNAEALEEISKCETPEMRDRIRALRVFAGTVKVKTDQNNSMFIQACGAILAGCPTSKLPGFVEKSECYEEEKPKEKARRI